MDSAGIVLKETNVNSIVGFQGAAGIINDFYTTYNIQNDGSRRRKVPFSLRQNQEDMIEQLKTYYTDIAQRTLSYINSEALLPVLNTDAQFIESSTHCFEPQAVSAVAPLGTLNLTEWYKTHSRTALNTYGLATKWEADRLGDPEGLQEYLLSMAQILKGIRLFVEYDGFHKVQGAGMPDVEAMMDLPDLGWYDQILRLRDYFGQGNYSPSAMFAGFTSMRSELTLQCDFEPTIIMVPRSVRPLFQSRNNMLTSYDKGGERAVTRFLDNVLIDRFGAMDIVEAPMVNMRSDGLGAESMLRNYAQVGSYWRTTMMEHLYKYNEGGGTVSQKAQTIRISSYDTRMKEDITLEHMIMNDCVWDNSVEGRPDMGKATDAERASHPFFSSDGRSILTIRGAFEKVNKGNIVEQMEAAYNGASNKDEVRAMENAL
ncbi:MAG: hypothetical protein MI810_22575, partial [Flavobacteriales bacterium]|nr:hypothetical protein [Flavobacteriales bacterium]